MMFPEPTPAYSQQPNVGVPPIASDMFPTLPEHQATNYPPNAEINQPCYQPNGYQQPPPVGYPQQFQPPNGNLQQPPQQTTGVEPQQPQPFSRGPQGEQNITPIDVVSTFSHDQVDRLIGEKPEGYKYYQSKFTKSGKKKALLIGINYFQTPFELKGCLNDVKNIKEFLLGRGFEDTPETMTVLTDDNPNKLPLRSNIISACKWLVEGAEPGDSLFFHYSGHGEQVHDKSGDEVDGLDETILPLDFKKAGYIVDDDLHDMLVKPLKEGVRLTALFDSCHSGTALDLPYIFKWDGTYHDVGLSHHLVGNTLQEAGVEALQGDTEHAKEKVKNLAKVIFGAKKKAKILRKKNSSLAEVFMFSGCKDEQNAADGAVVEEDYDEVEVKKATGLMSYSLVTALKRKPEQTLLELITNMRAIIKERDLPQKPQLSTSHPIDPNVPFEI